MEKSFKQSGNPFIKNKPKKKGKEAKIENIELTEIIDNPIKLKEFNFGKTMDLNVDRYGPSAGETKAMDKFKFTKNNNKKVPKRDYATVRNEMANAKKGSDEWHKLAKELEGTSIVRKNVKKKEQVGKII